MAVTQVRGNAQVKDGSLNIEKLEANILKGKNWVLSDDNTAIISGVSNPLNANDVVNKQYVDGIANSQSKSPDGFATTAAGAYPTDYKGTGTVSDGDSFYVTNIDNGSAIGGLTVNVGDMLVALKDSPTTDADWLVLESNVSNATTTTSGVVTLATTTEINDTSISNDKVVTLATFRSVEHGAGAGIQFDDSNNYSVKADFQTLIATGGDDNATLTVKLQANGGLTSSTQGIGFSGNYQGDTWATTTTTSTNIASNGTTTISGNSGVSITSADADVVIGGSVRVGSSSGATVDEVRFAKSGAVSGNVDNAVASVEYVKSALNSEKDVWVFNELPLVNAGSADVGLQKTPQPNSQQVYLNGVRQAPVSDYTISGQIVTFVSPLSNGDVVLVDYIEAPGIQ